MDTLTYDETTEEALFGIPTDARPRQHAFMCAMDNYEPTPRHVADGYVVFYTHTPRHEEDKPYAHLQVETRAMMSGNRYGFQFPAVFIMDDGHNVWPMWSGSAHDGDPSPLYPEGCEPHAILYPFPTNNIPRADTGEPANFDRWMLGPRKVYHLKLTVTSPRRP